MDGFTIKMMAEMKSQFSIDRMPAIFENSRGVTEVPSYEVPGGSGSSIDEVCPDSVLAWQVTARQIGDWQAFAITDGEGRCVATRQGVPRPGPGLPSQLSLEIVSQDWAGVANVRSPSEPFDEAGIRFYVADTVEVRGTTGLYLRRESMSAGGAPPAVHELLWLEEGAYWRLAVSESYTDDQFDLLGQLQIAAGSIREVPS